MAEAVAETSCKVDEEDGDTVLQKAVKDNDVSQIKKLISQGADVNECSKDDWSPLHVAASFNTNDSHFEAIEVLLKNGANVNARNDLGSSPLYYLVTETHDQHNLKTIKLFSNFGADFNLQDNKGLVPLIGAISEGSIEVVKLLVECGSAIDNINFTNERTPLHEACRYGKVKVIKFLLKNGADVNALDGKGQTPLFHLLNSIASVSAIPVFFMIKYADVNVINNGGHNILDHAPPLNIWKVVLEHLAKLQVLDLNVHPSLYDTISNKDEYSEYFIKCTEELSLAKNKKLKNSWITLFDLLVDDRKKLKNYAGNKDLIKHFQSSDFLQEFPVYGAQIQAKVNKGLERRELFDKSSIVLSKFLPIFNPNHLIIKDILDCLLSTKDLFGLKFE